MDKGRLFAVPGQRTIWVSAGIAASAPLPRCHVYIRLSSLIRVGGVIEDILVIVH